MSLTRLVRAPLGLLTVLTGSVLIAPLAASPADSPQPYHVVATLPDVVDGQALRTFVFDREARRFYAGSQFGLYMADLTSSTPKMTGPIVRKNISKVESAFDLGRVFYAAVDEIGYVDAAGGPPVKISGGNALDLVYEPTQHEIYAAFARSSELLVFDARTGKRRPSIQLPGWNAYELEAIPGRVFMLVGGKDGIYSIDANTHSVAPWPVEGHLLTPGTLKADPDGKYLFIARNQEVDAIDVSTSKVIGRLTMYGTAAIGFDPGTGLLVASWYDITGGDSKQRVAAFRPDPSGLIKVAELKNPDIGRVGIETTSHGFVQAAFHGLLVWSSDAAKPLVKSSGGR